MGRAKSKYTLGRKEAIVAEAYSKPNHIRATALKYEVQPRDIRFWSRGFAVAKTQFSPRKWKAKSRGYSLTPGRAAKHGDKDDALASYLDNLRKDDRPVTVSLLCAEYKRLNPEDCEVPNFLIRQRIYRWMTRKHYCIRRITHQAQNTRHCADLIADWVDYICNQIKMLGVPPSNVVNFDETNANFSIDSTTTVNRKGERTVSVKRAKSTQRATVFLGVSMAGERLTPYIIFKGVDRASGRVQREFNSAKHSYPQTMKYTVQENAWMDETRMLDWIQQVWKPWADSKTGATYLIIDEFSAHMTTKVRTALANCDTDVDFIIGGYTAKLQVMDVGVNRTFKDEYRRQFELFMVKNDNAKPLREDVSKWVWNAWESITSESIRNTWLKVFQHAKLQLVRNDSDDNNDDNASNDDNADDNDNLFSDDDNDDNANDNDNNNASNEDNGDEHLFSDDDNASNDDNANDNDNDNAEEHLFSV
jgi:hypothetical protein